MNILPKPRAIEFMVRGFTVAQMYRILEHWREATEDDLRRMGFIDESPVNLADFAAARGIRIVHRGEP